MNIIDKARNSIGRYCAQECHAYCCRNGKLIITEEEAKIFPEAKRTSQGYSIDLDKGCAWNKENKCTIYAERPKACREFPIFVKDKLIIMAGKCPAVQENKFYKFEAEMIKKGYKIVIAPDPAEYIITLG